MSTITYKVNGSLAKEFQTSLPPEYGFLDLITELTRDEPNPLQIDMWFSSDTSVLPDRRHEHMGNVQT
jgi:hypothetical protein